MTTYEQKLEADVAARIVNDLANHTIAVKREDGLYRHYRCQNGTSSNLYFDVVTWPGSLCFTGDMGDFLFQRAPDMIAFMSTAIRDRSYIAQKCVAGKVKEWREEAFEEVLAERLAWSLEDGGDGTYRVTGIGGKREYRSVAEAIEEIRDEYANYNSQHDAAKAMYESGLWDEVPSCKEWTCHFIWCLHAMKWFCEKLKTKGIA